MLETRLLLWQDKSAEFFEQDNPIWNELFETFYKQVFDHAQQKCLDKTEVLNDVYYYGVYLYNRPNPQMGGLNRSFDMFEDFYPNHRATSALWAMLYVLLYLQVEKPDYIKNDIFSIENKIQDNRIQKKMIQFMIDFLGNHPLLNTDFDVHPSNPRQFPEKFNWYIGTNRYSRRKIVEIVDSYNKKDDKLLVLDVIIRNYETDKILIDTCRKGIISMDELQMLRNEIADKPEIEQPVTQRTDTTQPADKEEYIIYLQHRQKFLQMQDEVRSSVVKDLQNITLQSKTSEELARSEALLKKVKAENDVLQSLVSAKQIEINDLSRVVEELKLQSSTPIVLEKTIVKEVEKQVEIEKLEFVESPFSQAVSLDNILKYAMELSKDDADVIISMLNELLLETDDKSIRHEVKEKTQKVRAYFKKMNQTNIIASQTNNGCQQFNGTITDSTFQR